MLPAENVADLKASHSDCVVWSSHQAALQKEKNELARVKLELEQVKKAKADMEATWTEELRLQDGRMKEIQGKLDEDALENQVESLKAKPAEWLSELRWINGQMAGEFSAPASFPCSSPNACIPRHRRSSRRCSPSKLKV